MSAQHFTDKLGLLIEQDSSLNESQKLQWLTRISQIKKTKINLLITGATGCGKSSTINALFATEKAKVGQGVDPETMDIAKFELDSLVLFDSPGLGDGKEADRRHSKNIIDKLNETDQNGNLLIDLVLVVLDGSSRDLGTSFELINQVIIPNLGQDKNRLLVAINQADMAMKGRHWDHQTNQPEPELVKFLAEKVSSTRRRIFEATQVEVTPIYYAAGYKEGNIEQRPYNMSKLLLHIIQSVQQEKRAALIQDINREEQIWQDDDELIDYQQEINQTLWQSVCAGAEKGAEIGGKIGSLFGRPGEAIGSTIGTVVGGVCGFIGSFF
ncbi:50S ribosome-binding GTPase [Vibrio metschnikovii]|nr:50S ribosome-binding GTPase [Vibrio metschnikovii]